MDKSMNISERLRVVLDLLEEILAQAEQKN